MSDSLIPITDEQAKSIQEAFKFGTTSIEAARELGKGIASVLGTLPADLVGYLGGDWLRAKRAENLSSIINKSHWVNEKQGIQGSEAVSLNVGIPLLEAACNESREELQDLWARLIVAAQDPARSSSMRLDFIKAVRSFAPDDAAVFCCLSAGVKVTTTARNAIVQALAISTDRVQVALDKLTELGCLQNLNNSLPGESAAPSTFGRELWRILTGI